MDISGQVLQALVEITQAPQVREQPDLRLYDLHLLDSFKTIELLVALSERLGVELSPAEFEREEWATPRAIIQTLEHKLASEAV